MVYRKTENAMTEMIGDTILALCRNKLPYRGMLRVEGLVAITLDDEEIFLVNVNETICQEDEIELKETAFENAGRRLRPRGKRHISEIRDNSDSEEEYLKTKKHKNKRGRPKSKVKNQKRKEDSVSCRVASHENKNITPADPGLEDSKDNNKGEESQEAEVRQPVQCEGYTTVPENKDFTADFFTDSNMAQTAWTENVEQTEQRCGGGIEHLQNLAFQLSRDIHAQANSAVSVILRFLSSFTFHAEWDQYALLVPVIKIRENVHVQYDFMFSLFWDH